MLIIQLLTFDEVNVMIYQPWRFDIHRGQRLRWMMSTSLKVNISFLKCIQNLYLASLWPKKFNLWIEEWIKNKLWVNQTTRARWTSYYDVTIPCTSIHVWWHLFTYGGIYSPLKDDFQLTSNGITQHRTWSWPIRNERFWKHLIIVILYDFCQAIKHFFPKYTTDIFSQNCDEFFSY